MATETVRASEPVVAAGLSLPQSLPLRALASWLVIVLACAVDLVLLATTHATPGFDPLAIALMAAVVVANYISLPIGHAARLWFTSVPLYLMAALLSPPVAMLAAGIGMGVKEIAICRKCGNTVEQVVGQVGRWMFLILGASALFQLADPLFVGVLVVPLLWLGDVATAPLVLRGRPSVTLYRSLVRQTWTDEWMQYILAYFALPAFLMIRSGPLIAIPALSLLVLWFVFYLGIRQDTVRADPREGKQAP